MRCTVRINSGRGSKIERIGNLGKTPVESQITRDLNRAFGFVTIGPAGTFEFKRSIVRDIDLLVRLVNEKDVGRQGKALPDHAGPAGRAGEIPLIHLPRGDAT